jgi:hypothetical protein
MPRNAGGDEKRRFHALLAKFREAAADNLDEDEKLLMRRIAENAVAPSIFAAVENDATVKRLLWLCVTSFTIWYYLSLILSFAQ